MLVIMASATTFDLSGKQLKLNTADDIKPHLEPLTKSSSFTAIHFNGNTIGIAAAEHFATVLATQKELEYVNFADIFTGRLLSEIPQALEALLGALVQLPKLNTVDLSDNAFGLNLVGPLVKFLKSHVPLQHLVLNNNGMGPIAGAQIADSLTELAARKTEARKDGKTIPDLESIVCGRNRLEAGSMEAWAKAYASLGKVKSVKMTQNGIRIEGIDTLLRKGLANCKELEVLDLQDNTFTVIGGKALAAVVQEWPNINTIGTSDCLVTARGFKYVVRALAEGKNKKLHTFRSQFNEVDAKGVEQLVAATEKGGLPELRRVELNGNRFEEDDANVEKLKSILDERRDAAGAEEDDESWGLDELDELEEPSDDEEEEEDDDDEDETAKVAEKVTADADLAESEPVAQTADTDVDDLADALGKKLGV